MQQRLSSVDSTSSYGKIEISCNGNKTPNEKCGSNWDGSGITYAGTHSIQGAN